MKKRPISWKKIKSDWICEFADNGWLDWICPKCGLPVWNDDIHVSLDWNYCPYCGEKNIEIIEELSNEERNKMLEEIRNEDLL